MASIQPRSGKWQLRVKHKLLPKPFFYTFATEKEARDYGDQLESLLDRGVVPMELAGEPAQDRTLLSKVVGDYEKLAPVTDSDTDLLKSMGPEIQGVRMGQITYKWVEAYVRGLKTGKNLSPGTIRKRVGVLARVLDWHLRRTVKDGDQMPSNPFRLLPSGYSTYSREETKVVEAAGKKAKRDRSVDRRLLPDEEARVRAALAGIKRSDRERPLKVDPDFALLFDLILETGLRLMEAYKLRTDQVDAAGFLRVEGTKGWRGAIKPRTVPLRDALRDRLLAHGEGKVLLFPFWDGTEEGEKRASSKLSVRFGGLFDYAKVPEFTEHVLRHEATCRWFEMRDERGGWVFSDVEICRIMGWSSLNMALRYASIRGGDLSVRMRGLG